MQFFILICNDADNRVLSAPSALQLAKYRLQSGFWGFNESTPHRKRIQVGDRFLVYLSGTRQNGRCFIGSAMAKAFPYKTTNKSLDSQDPRWDRGSRILLPLGEVEFFDTPVHISRVVGGVKFIPQERQEIWWHFLRSGCRLIQECDYKAILAESRKR
jgi:hypothetical protein